MNPGSDWRDVEQVMAAFLDLPEDQRTAYLEQQPSDIRQEVESLVSAYRRSGSFLGTAADKPSITAKLLTAMRNAILEANHGTDATRFTVKPGTDLGPYRIEWIIGKGGMGVVYRALDTRLNRPVAVKFLSEDFADATARRRFQREAQMASALNHPHILTVYDAGDFEGRQYLVTEFIDVGTLKDWARKQTRTWREIVTLLSGVADGLAAAHTAGILHRDIKPDNILVGSNGYAKLSDFGLAKLEEHPAPHEGTATLTATGPGLIIGTFAYMSPEQAAGRPLDARSDLFSFGIVLYELLAGHRPFEGKTDRELLQTIIQGTPPPLAADIPLPLRMSVEKLLENAPSDRYQSARDLVVDLRRLTRQSGESAVSVAPTTQTAAPGQPVLRSKRGLVLALISLAVLLAGGSILYRTLHPAAEAPRQVVQFEIASPPGTIFTPTISRQPFAMSPDGKRLAFTATGANGTNLWIRDLASLEMREMAGTGDVWSMYWAPDSRSIYFSVRRTLKQVNLDTGSLRTVAELENIPMLASWRPNGDMLLYMGGGELWELHPSDGSVRKGKAIEGIRWPQFLPGSDRLIYAVYDNTARVTHLVTADYENPKPLILTRSDTRAIYSASPHAGKPGYLLFIRGGDLLAQQFDAGRLQLSGEPMPVAQNVAYFGPNLGASISVSGNGVLAYQAGFPNAELKWYDRAGNTTGTVGQPLPLWGNVRLSGDGRRVAAAVWSNDFGSQSIWMFDADGRNSRRFSFPPDIELRPVWSPDGTKLAVGTSLKGGPWLALINAAGGVPEMFPKIPDFPMVLPTDWSRDGRFIAMDDGVGEEQHAAWIADVASRKVSPLLKNSFAQWGVAFAPDGKQIAFVSTESGRPQVYLQAFEPSPTPHTTGERRQVSRDGAWLARWRADGRELFFLGLDNTMNTAPVQGTLQFGEPKGLFRVAGVTQYATTRDFQFDVSPDGQRFIIPNTGTIPPPPFTVIENWQEKFRN